MTQLAPEDPRLQQLTAWLNHSFADQPFTIKPLAGDASFRRYLRVYFYEPTVDVSSDNDVVSKSDQDKVTQVYLVMDAPPDKESVTEFVTLAELMGQVVNVPTIIAKDIAQGFLVLQDFGTTEFAHLIKDASEQAVDSYYKWAMKTLIELQGIDIEYARQQANVPDYDNKMLEREMQLFSEWFLPYIGLSVDDKLDIWQDFMAGLVSLIQMQPKVLVHRDYHSRNLMRDQHNPDDLGVIDFQDAVIGAYSYDLVSLLRDAYVEWREDQIDAWVHTFWQLQQDAGLPTAKDAVAFMTDVNVMGVQRHLKILGIFVRLAQRDGKQRYLADLPKVMQDLGTELAWLNQNSELSQYRWFQRFYDWIVNEIQPQYVKSLG